MLTNTVIGRRKMVPWIMNNLEKIAIVIIMVPMIVGFGMGIFFVIDEQLKNFKFYGNLMYGKLERDDEYAEEFFGKAFLSTGIVSILTPFIVIFSYLYITGKTISDLWLNK